LEGEEGFNGLIQQGGGDGGGEAALEGEGAFEALARTIRDRPAVGASREGPTAEAAVAEIGFFLRQVLHNLVVSDKAISFFQEVGGCLGDRGGGGEDGLYSEGGIPELAGVIALKFHTVMSVPEIVLQASEAALKVVLAVFAQEVDEGIEDGINGADINVVGGLVFIEDVLEAGVNGLLAYAFGVEGLIGGLGLVNAQEELGLGAEVVLFADGGALFFPGDVGPLSIPQLFTQCEGEGGEGGLSALAIEPRHGQIDLSAVAPKPAGVEGFFQWGQPQLRQDGPNAAPLIKAHEAEDKFSPRGGAGGAAVLLQPRAHVGQGCFLRGGAEDAQGDIIECRTKHAAPVVLGMQADGAVLALGIEYIGTHTLPSLCIGQALSGLAEGDIHGQEEGRAAIVPQPASVHMLEAPQVFNGPVHGNRGALREAVPGRGGGVWVGAKSFTHSGQGEGVVGSGEAAGGGVVGWQEGGSGLILP